MPNKPRRLEARIEDKIEKMKVECCRHKSLLEEQTNSFGSTWPWFDKMRHIMGVLQKVMI